jgi:endo-1,4-beta-mannosidase
LNRRRFLKYAGATAAIVGASAFGVEYVFTKLTSRNEPSNLVAYTSSAHTSTSSVLGSRTSPSPSTAGTTTTPAHTSAKEDFVTIENAAFTLKGRPFTLKGFNYFPRDHPWRIFNEWDAAEVDSELELGEDLNANCVRTGINYQFSTNNVYYQHSWQDFHVDQAYLDCVESFLALADKHNLKVILTLFGYVYWELISPGGYWVGENYLQELIPRFADDARILGWDVCNEPDLGHFPHAGVDNTVGFLQTMSNKIHELDKNHPTTIGLAMASNTSKIEDFTDFLSFHYYGPADSLRSEAIPLARFEKPIVLEEFGKHSDPNRPGDPSNERLQRQHYLETLQTIQAGGMQNFCGELFWCLLDYPVFNDPQESPLRGEDIFENHMGVFRLSYAPKPAADIVRKYYQA